MSPGPATNLIPRVPVIAKFHAGMGPLHHLVAVQVNPVKQILQVVPAVSQNIALPGSDTVHHGGTAKLAQHIVAGPFARLYARKIPGIEHLPRAEHPFYVGTQAHPELKSRPTQPHPLFVGLIEAAVKRKLSARLPDVEA